MLRLKYTLKNDEFQWVSVLGDAEGIRNLYWQLTQNYAPRDGQAIGTIVVLDMDGHDVTEQVMTNPHAHGGLSRLQRI